MKTLLFVLFSTTAFAEVDCSKHKIYCKIKDLKPSMADSKAMSLSNKIYKYSRKHGGDPMLAVAIAMQETGLQDINRKQNIIKFEEKCLNGICNKTWSVKRGVTDICMFQFHVNTILTYNMDPIKLNEDIDYCIQWHFKLMNKKKRYCKHLDKPWGCYHSKTKVLREHYIELVERYL